MIPDKKRLEELEAQDLEADKWFFEFQNVSKERKEEMLLEQDKEMVLDDLKSCSLTRVQVDELIKLRDSFEELSK